MILASCTLRDPLADVAAMKLSEPKGSQSGFRMLLISPVVPEVSENVYNSDDNAYRGYP
ncbi:hypothetical protein ABIE18_004456 [Arthrobacter sp. 2762]